MEARTLTRAAAPKKRTAEHSESKKAKASSKKASLPVNAEVLVWARNRYGLSQEVAAKKLKVKVERLIDWESGARIPTAIQLRKLAGIYHRHYLEFMGPTVPPVQETKLVPDYRLFRNGPSKDGHKQLARVQEWAEEIRLNAISLIESLDDETPLLTPNLRFETDADPEAAAEIAREAASFPIQEQIDIPPKEKYRFPEMLRQRIESLGILVLKSGELTNVGARGMCLFQEPLPVIVFSSESPGAQAFTLAHELGHVLLGDSGISGNPNAGTSDMNPQNQTEEIWCNRFSAAFLVPASALFAICERPEYPMADFDMELFSTLSRKFAVSRHAMVIRLVSLGYVDEKFYWKELRPLLLDYEKNYKGGGIAKYYGKRYVSRVGRFYTSLVIDAWNSDLISPHNACEYMGIKNMQHLLDIRKNEALRL